MDDSSSFACGVNRASRTNKTLYSLPVHCLTQTDLQLENAKGIMQHFHAPANSHNRFLASLTQQERAILRDFERPPPYNSTGTHDGEHGWQLNQDNHTMCIFVVFAPCCMQLQTCMQADSL